MTHGELNLLGIVAAEASAYQRDAAFQTKVALEKLKGLPNEKAWTAASETLWQEATDRVIEHGIADFAFSLDKGTNLRTGENYRDNQAYEQNQAKPLETQETVGKTAPETRKEYQKQKKGKVHYDGDVTSLTKRQRTNLKGLEVISDALGVDIYIFESETAPDGVTRIGANGWYDPRDGSVHIDLYAGADGKGTMLFTAAHELTHFIKDQSQARFKTLSDFLIEQYGKKDVSVQQLVENQMEKAKNAGYELDKDGAFEEMVADSMESMLTDGKVLQELKQRNKGLWQTVKDYVLELCEKIRKVYKRLKPDSLEGRMVAEMRDAAEEMRRLFTEGLLDAGKNYRVTAGESTVQQDSGKLYSNRNVREVTKNDVKTLLEEIKDGTISGRGYIPIRISTPGIVQERLFSQDNPIVMPVAKAYQAMSIDGGEVKGKNIRGHGLSEDDLIAIAERMDSPDFIYAQPENDRGIEVIKYKSSENNIAVVIEFDNAINPIYLNGYKGGMYNVAVTTFKIDGGIAGLFQYAEEKGWQEVFNKEKEGDPAKKFPATRPFAVEQDPLTERVPQKTSAVKKKSPLREGDVKYSVRETTDGQFVAVVDNDILRGIDISNWNKETRKAAKKAAVDALKQFHGGFLINGIEYIDAKRHRDEYTRSNYTEALARKDRAAYLDKMRAASVLDDVIRVATGWKNDDNLKYERGDFDSFIRGSALIQSGTNSYSATVLAGIDKNGTAVFYDVVEIAPATFAVKESELPTAVQADKPLNAILRNSDTNSIYGSDEDVKEKFSLRDQDVRKSKPSYERWDVEEALWDAMDHADSGDDNMIRIGNMPKFVSENFGIQGDFYIYRNHAYENMVSEDQAKKEGRYKTKSHYHGLGVDTMADAIMNLETPIVSIASKTKEGNPAIICILPVLGKNRAPLYAVMSFYSNKPVNGDYSRKPHIVLTIAERSFTENGGRTGLLDIVENAVKDGKILSFDKEKRDYLSVNAKATSLSIVTEQSLRKNIADFKKNVKEFREENKINYSLRNQDVRKMNAMPEKEDVTHQQGEVENEFIIRESNGILFSNRDAHDVTRKEVKELLEKVETGEISGRNYIPIRVSTPSIVQERLFTQDNPIVMPVTKAFQAMSPDKGAVPGKNIRGYSLSPDDLLTIIERMDSPDYLYTQPENDRGIEVIKWKSGKSNIAVVIEFDNAIKATYINGYKGGIYNVAITAFEIDGGIAGLFQYSIDKGWQEVYSKEKEGDPAKKVPATRPFAIEQDSLQDRVPQAGQNVNAKNEADTQKTYERKKYSFSFTRQVAEYVEGKRPRGEALTVGDTPEVFQKIGFPNLPMTISTDHVDFGMYGAKVVDPNRGTVVFGQLSESVKKPIAVFTSQEQVVALLPFTVKEKQVVTPFVVEVAENGNTLRIHDSVLGSAFGKTREAGRLLYDGLKAEKSGMPTMLYVNKKEAEALLKQTGLPMRGALTLDGFVRGMEDNGESTEADMPTGAEPDGTLTLKNAAGHEIIKVTKTLLTGKPGSITQYATSKGGIERNYYGDDGRQYKQVASCHHGHPKQHPYGVHGEHAHDYTYDENGKLIGRVTRELTDLERKENADILWPN